MFKGSWACHGSLFGNMSYYEYGDPCLLRHPHESGCNFLYLGYTSRCRLHVIRNYGLYGIYNNDLWSVLLDILLHILEIVDTEKQHILCKISDTLCPHLYL